MADKYVVITLQLKEHEVDLLRNFLELEWDVAEPGSDYETMWQVILNQLP